MSWRHLQNFLKTSWRRFSKTSWRHLEDILKTSWQDILDVLKTSWRRMTKANTLVLIKTSWRRLEDVFWRRMSKVNIFVLIKTSSEDKDERRLQDVFIKTNLCWVLALDCRQSKYLITIFLNFRLGFCGSFFLCYFQNSSFVVKKFSNNICCIVCFYLHELKSCVSDFKNIKLEVLKLVSCIFYFLVKL